LESAERLGATATPAAAAATAAAAAAAAELTGKRIAELLEQCGESTCVGSAGSVGSVISGE
jgi:hypothetical protein